MNTSDGITRGDRLESVDALRGFALLAIVLLHNLEHYNIFYGAAAGPAWLQWLDTNTTQLFYFLFAGKAYATFSLLFGFSFFVQMRNARERGHDFRARFAWRMLLLAGFSQLHALFYNGDILLLYAVCGLILIPASSWSNRTVLTVATALMLQPWCWAKIIYALLNPEYIDTNSGFTAFAASAQEVGRNGNLIQTLLNNIWNGQLYSNYWQVEAGRLFQTPALFLFGMWLGRKAYFRNSPESRGFWQKAIVWAMAACIPLYLLKTLVPPHIEQLTVLSYYGIAIPMLYNFAFMTLLVALFMTAWFRAGNGYRAQRFISPYGRMSLTNYITQSILGVAVYYHCGLDLWDKTGPFVSLLIALCIFGVQYAWSVKWLATHRQGPLERLWKIGTWLGSRPTAKARA